MFILLYYTSCMHVLKLVDSFFVRVRKIDYCFCFAKILNVNNIDKSTYCVITLHLLEYRNLLSEYKQIVLVQYNIG